MATVLDSVRAFFAPSQTYTIDTETPADVVARETLLDRAMGADRRKKSSEKIRRNRLPAEGLALVARDGDGHVIRFVCGTSKPAFRRKAIRSKRFCSGRLPYLTIRKAEESVAH